MLMPHDEDANTVLLFAIDDEEGIASSGYIRRPCAIFVPMLGFSVTMPTTRSYSRKSARQRRGRS